MVKFVMVLSSVLFETEYLFLVVILFTCLCVVRCNQCIYSGRTNEIENI